MRPLMPLGDFLVAYLKKIGVTHVFGIPGDLVLRLFARLPPRPDLRIVTLSHEPGVGFAANGYARATGRIGVACVTYGAGGHNMVNAVAGSSPEPGPVLVLSGGPGDEERRLGTLIHHQAKEVESQRRIYEEVSAAARLIDAPTPGPAHRRPQRGRGDDPRRRPHDVAGAAPGLPRDPPRHGRAPRPRAARDH